MALEYKRLSDRILFALELALEQKDMAISDDLMTALEQSITRSFNGKVFAERREMGPEYEVAIAQFEALRNEQKSKAN